MKVSVIVATYNNPAYLRLALTSLLRQSRLPDEILVADDGSTTPTRQLIEELAKTAPVPIIHVWHEDRGFRLAEIRNKAIARASGDYIIQIDGDIAVHPRFVADHIAVAEKGCFIRGTRVRLNEKQSQLAVAKGAIPASVDLSLLLTQPFNRLRFPGQMARVRRDASGAKVKGCNMAFWRDDLLRVNGYDNRLQGWGHEDEELAWRLINSGLKKKSVKLKAVAYHLYHPELSQEKEPEQRRAADRSAASNDFFTPDGIVKKL